MLHFLDDLAVFIESCERAGASPSCTRLFYKEYNYPNRKKLVEYFQGRGYAVSPVKEVAAVLRDLERAGRRDIVVIEDGGYIVPALHKGHPGLGEGLSRGRGADSCRNQK